MPSVNTGPELTPQACAPLASRGPRTVREADRLSPAVARSWAAGKLLSAAGEERLSRNAASGRGSVLPAPTYSRGWTRTTATSVYVCVDLHRWFRTRFGRRAPPLLFPCAPDGALRLRGQISGDGVLLPGCAFTSSVPLSVSVMDAAWTWRCGGFDCFSDVCFLALAGGPSFSAGFAVTCFFCVCSPAVCPPHTCLPSSTGIQIESAAMQCSGLLNVLLLVSLSVTDTASASTTNSDSMPLAPSTYSAAAGFAREVSHDYFVAGAALIAAAVILI